MADDINPQGGLASAADRFPFVMLITSTFLLGAMFVILNGPLIVLGLDKKQPFANLAAIIVKGVVPLWRTVLQSKRKHSYWVLVSRIEPSRWVAPNSH